MGYKVVDWNYHYEKKRVMVAMYVNHWWDLAMFPWVCGLVLGNQSIN